MNNRGPESALIKQVQLCTKQRGHCTLMSFHLERQPNTKILAPKIQVIVPTDYVIQEKHKNTFHHVLWTLVGVVTLPTLATFKDSRGRNMRPNEAVFLKKKKKKNQPLKHGQANC